MEKNVESIVEQINALLKVYEEKMESFTTRKMGSLDPRLIPSLNTRLLDGINRFAPVNSSAIKSAQMAIEKESVSNSCVAGQFAGILEALKDDYKDGYLESVQELIHADLFSDFLEMADHLLDGGYKDAAAVIAGSTLEEHLRKLCEKSEIDPVKHTDKGDVPHKARRLNDELKKADIYNNLVKENVTAWLTLRNHAAHGKYDEYDHKQVAVMIQGIRDFMLHKPA